MKKTFIVIVLGLFLLAVLYSFNQDMVSKIVSFIFITMGTELVPAYYENKGNAYKILKDFNEDYYNMHVAYITMHTKLLVLSFGVLFPCLYEVIRCWLTYPCDIGNILVPFVLSFLLNVFIEIGIWAMFDTTKYAKVYIKIFKNKKCNFLLEFTDEEKKAIQDRLRQ